MNFEKMEQYWNDNIKQYVPFRRGLVNTYANLVGMLLMAYYIAFYYNEPTHLLIIMAVISGWIIWTNLWMHTIFYWLLGGIIFSVFSIFANIIGQFELWVFLMWGNISVIMRKWDSYPVKSLIRKMLRVTQ